MKRMEAGGSGEIDREEFLEVFEPLQVRTTRTHLSVHEYRYLRRETEERPAIRKQS
jgi:hypothetical protein